MALIETDKSATLSNYYKLVTGAYSYLDDLYWLLRDALALRSVRFDGAGDLLESCLERAKASKPPAGLGRYHQAIINELDSAASAFRANPSEFDFTRLHLETAYVMVDQVINLVLRKEARLELGDTDKTVSPLDGLAIPADAKAISITSERVKASPIVIGTAPLIVTGSILRDRFKKAFNAHQVSNYFVVPSQHIVVVNRKLCVEAIAAVQKDTEQNDLTILDLVNASVYRLSERENTLYELVIPKPALTDYFDTPVLFYWILPRRQVDVLRHCFLGERIQSLNFSLATL